jgi:hypothetical protein
MSHTERVNMVTKWIHLAQNMGHLFFFEPVMKLRVY